MSTRHEQAQEMIVKVQQLLRGAGVPVRPTLRVIEGDQTREVLRAAG